MIPNQPNSPGNNSGQPEAATANKQPKVLRMLALFVSYLCHPIFMPLILAVMLSKLPSFPGVTEKQVGMWLLIIGTTGVFFPLVTILLMKPLGFIGSYQMPTARERTIPLMASMIFYFWVSQVFNRMPDPSVPLILKVFLLGNFWGIIVVFIANIFTKISMHTAAAGGMVGIILIAMLMSPVNMVIPFFASLLIAGIIGSARMVLGAHQRGDIWLGYLVGILVQVGAYIYMK